MLFLFDTEKDVIFFWKLGCISVATRECAPLYFFCALRGHFDKQEQHNRKGVSWGCGVCDYAVPTSGRANVVVQNPSGRLALKKMVVFDNDINLVLRRGAIL